MEIGSGAPLAADPAEQQHHVASSAASMRMVHKVMKNANVTPEFIAVGKKLRADIRAFEAEAAAATTNDSNQTTVTAAAQASGPAVDGPERPHPEFQLNLSRPQHAHAPVGPGQL